MGLIKQFTGSFAKKKGQEALGAIQGAQSSATGAIQTAANKAEGYMTPWLDQGARRMRNASLGLGSQEEMDAAWDTYSRNPALAKARELDGKRAGWAFNSRGGYGAGAHALADSEINWRHANDWQNALGRVAGEEFGAAGNMANIATGAGNALANTYMGGANAQANIYGKMMEPIFANNVIGGVSALGSLFGGGGGGKEGGKSGAANNLLKFFTG